MAKEFASMTPAEQQNYLQELRFRRLKLGVTTACMAEHLGFSRSFINRTETGKGIVRPGVISAMVRFLDDVERGDLKVPRTKRYCAVRAPQPQQPRGVNTANRIVGNVASQPACPEIGLGLGIVRRNLRKSYEEACSVLRCSRQVLMLKEAGISVMTLGETTRLLGYYAKCAAEKLSGGQQLIDFEDSITI